MTEMIPIIGLMAGTSVDGIDAALITSNGTEVHATAHSLSIPYGDKTRKAIFKAYNTTPSGQQLQELGLMIAKDHAHACKMLIKNSGVRPKLIGFHGQTIYHAPPISIQAGDAKYLAKHLGIPVAHSFRQNDLKHGGEGAPLAPIYHQTLIEQLQMPLPSAVVNIGGISNASIWDGQKLTGFDTGPGNALMDDAMRQHDRTNLDQDGMMAARGTPDSALVDHIMTHPYFNKAGPKSLDRMALHEFAADINNMMTEDKLATLTLLTARSLVDGVLRNNKAIKTMVICGGGSLNPVLMRMIKHEALTMTIGQMEDHGIDSKFIEAQLIAFLAARTQARLPITFPNTTGVKTPQTGGIITYPDAS